MWDNPQGFPQVFLSKPNELSAMTRTLPSPEEYVERWDVGRLMNPHLPCPNCGRKIMSQDWCQWCKTQWTSEQIRRQEELRKQVINGYDEETKQRIRRVGYFRI